MWRRWRAAHLRLRKVRQDYWTCPPYKSLQLSDGIFGCAHHELPLRSESVNLLTVGPVLSITEQKLIQTCRVEHRHVGVTPLSKVFLEYGSVSTEDWDKCSRFNVLEPLHTLQQLPTMAMKRQLCNASRATANKLLELVLARGIDHAMRLCNQLELRLVLAREQIAFWRAKTPRRRCARHLRHQVPLRRRTCATKSHFALFWSS